MIRSTGKKRDLSVNSVLTGVYIVVSKRPVKRRLQ